MPLLCRVAVEIATDFEDVLNALVAKLALGGIFVAIGRNIDRPQISHEAICIDIMGLRLTSSAAGKILKML